MDADAERRNERSLSPVEAALLDYFIQLDAPHPVEFETFCAARPAIADELRRRYAEWMRLSQLIGAQRQATTLKARLMRRLGRDTDPGVTLEPDEASDDATTQSLRRLVKHSARETRYELRGEIARGGMGKIVKVWDSDLRRHSAMKIAMSRTREGPPDAARTDDQQVLARFLQEAQVTGQLEHPGIVPVHEIGIDDESYVYFTMPLVRGREFKDVLQLARAGREGWSQTRALAVMLKICEAVAYAHSRRVVHRDLKPGNVMVGRFGETYVMDWGLARVLDRSDARDLRPRPHEPMFTSIATDRRDALAASPDSPVETMDGQVIGTPCFMSPEQARGAIDEMGPRSDVYAIGAMLYQLLTGEMPYVPPSTRITPHTVLAALLHGPPRPVLEIDPSAPPELVSICEKAMARDPAQRYATASELARDIESYLENRPVGAREPTLSYVLTLAYRRNRAVVLTAAAALLLLLAAGGLYLRREIAAREVERDLADAERRSDELMYARALPAQADELFPALPSAIPALETWLGDVDRLLERRTSWSSAGTLAPDVVSSREFMLHSFEGLERLRPRVAERLALARELDDPGFLERRKFWALAKTEIAASPAYAAMGIAPVEGLVPLGRNPQTGLWEFWSVLSGVRPQWSDEVGCGAPRAEDGVVLVLLPAGTFAMGSPEGAPGHEPGEETYAVSVPALYVGKYEVTQAQWSRVMGDNPSLFRGGQAVTSPTLRALTFDDRQPVESIDWYRADEFCGRIGLTLLTDEQWEYACRAGAATNWSFGDEFSELAGRANLSDLTFESDTGWTRKSEEVDWSDGHALTSPIGSYPANQFGLHDLEGNVSEWCANWASGDWLAPGEPRRRSFRGGSFIQAPKICRCAQRQSEVPHGGNYARGLRVGLVAPLER